MIRKPIQHRLHLILLGVLAFLASYGDTYAKSYPIIAYGTRTFVAETTKSAGTLLVRVSRSMGSTT